jgi:MFS transporter, DHA1 family, tetracycline resistance protein
MNITQAKTFLIITVIIDSMGIGLIGPVMPALLKELGNTGVSTAAIWGGLLATSFAFMQFCFGPLLGNLSDSYGRRPVLLLSLFVMVIDYLIMGYASSIWILFIGRLVGGITAATHSTAMAYMADISKNNEKSQNFGLIGAAFGIGFVLGPLLGGVLGEFSSRAPFFAAAGLAFLNLCLGYFVLPETITDQNKRSFKLTRANPLAALKHLRKITGVGRLILILFAYDVAFYVYPAIWSYWSEEKFGWGPIQIGYSFAAFGLCMAFTQGYLMRVIIKYIGENRTVTMTLFINVISFFFIAFITDSWMVWVLIPVISLGVISGPALQGLMSQAVPDDQQGELQGLLTSITAIGMIISPLLMTFTFGFFTGFGKYIYFPGSPFIISFALIVICIILFSNRGNKGEK